VYFTFTSIFAWAPTYAWIQWEKVFKIILMTFIATMLIYGRERIRALMLTIVVSIGFYGVKGFFFVLRRGGSERVQGPENSFLEGNTFIGLAFTMVVPLMIFLARDEKRPWVRHGLHVMAFLTFVSTIFTYSRGAFLGLAVIIPLIFLRSKSKVIAACILIPMAVVGPMVIPESIFQRAELIQNYETESSANQRLQSWTVAWRLALDHPVSGAGFEFEYSPDEERWLRYTNDRYAWALQHSSAAHSIYFQVLGQHGFLALGAFLFLLFGALLSLQRTKRLSENNPDTSWMANYASGLQVGLIGYMVSGAFLSSAYFDLLYLYIALSAILSKELMSAQLERQVQRAHTGKGTKGQDEEPSATDPIADPMRRAGQEADSVP
jgi:probable O-glycosylation ligase (exosortase A-associated)